MVGIVATIAEAGPATAIRLALAMTLLQASIGSLNDLVDAPRDADRTPPKPIPGGVVSRPAAWLVVLATAAVGIALSVPSGRMTIALAVIVLGIGYAYDVWFKGTAWSWIPFAVGIPLLPAYGWLGTAGDMPPAFAILLPAAVVAGTALAISNALADIERDSTAGTESVATRLGARRAWAVQAVLLMGILAVAWISLAVAADGRGAITRSAPVLGAVGATLLIGAGIGLARDGGPARRERAWELEAIGIGVLAAAWLTAVALG